MNDTRDDFGRIEDGQLVKAPKILKIQIDGEATAKTLLHPMKEDYARSIPSYFPIMALDTPAVQPGYEVALDHYELSSMNNDTVIVPIYVTAPIDPGSDPSVEHALRQYDYTMEQYLRSVREARGYTSREPSDYAFSQNERWHQDALDWIAFRDSVMEYALSVMNDFKSNGTIVSLEDFMSGMPQMNWTIE